jgi:hypothetical protein
LPLARTRWTLFTPLNWRSCIPGEPMLNRSTGRRFSSTWGRRDESFRLYAGSHARRQFRRGVRSVTYSPEGRDNGERRTIPAVDQNARAWAIQTITRSRAGTDNREAGPSDIFEQDTGGRAGDAKEGVPVSSHSSATTHFDSPVQMDLQCT